MHTHAQQLGPFYLGPLLALLGQLCTALLVIAWGQLGAVGLSLLKPFFLLTRLTDWSGSLSPTHCPPWSLFLCSFLFLSPLILEMIC